VSSGPAPAPPGGGRPSGGRGSRVFADWSPLQLDHGYRAQWLGQLGSAIGRETAKYAFPIHVYLATGSLGLLGLVAVLQLITTVVFSLSSGTLSDLFDRRLIMLASLGVMTLATVGLLALSLASDAPLELVIALGVVVTTLFTMEQPARLSAVPRLVPPERLPAAIALTSLNFQAMSVAGPAVAAVFFGIAGLAGAYSLQLAGYAWATIASARMPSLPPAARELRSPVKMLAESFSFVRQRRIIQSAFAIDLNAMILALPAASLLPVLLIEAYGITPEVVGFLLAARGLGAVSAGLFSGWTRSVRRIGRAVISVVVFYATATLLLGLTTISFLAALPRVAICGATDVTSAILRNTIIQTATPDSLRGRVSALHTLSSAGGPRIGDMRAAAMAELFGAAGSLAIGGLMAIGGVALVARLYPELRGYRLPVGEVGSALSAAPATATRSSEVPPADP
jgi:MFS family permease